MSTEEPAWKAELREALQRIAWDIERGNGVQGGMDYARRDLESTVLDAIEAAEQRGRREAWEKAMDIADGTGAYLRRNYETEQSSGAYMVLGDLKRESP